MKGQLMEEIHRLTRLIEERKKMSGRLNPAKDAHGIFRETGDKYNVNATDNCTSLSSVGSQLNKQLAKRNVHVNPNFKIHNSVIHINPKIRTTPQIHVNPRIVKDVPVMSDSKYSYSNVKCSVYVNPKLMVKLASSMQSKNVMDKQMSIPKSNQTNCSPLKFVKNTGTLSGEDKRHSNSNMLVLSRRKLIRVKRSTKGSPANVPAVAPVRTKKFSRSPFKKVKFLPLKTLQRSITQANVVQSFSKNECSFKSNEISAKCGRYKIDRTNRFNTTTAKPGSINKKPTVVTIGGILYKSSRNQLVRRNLSVKKKRAANMKNDKIISSCSGKNLNQLKMTEGMHNCAGHKSTVLSSMIKEDKGKIGFSQKINYKNIMSTKAKRRSIQILCNKMRKNNQPCLLFQKFGFCANDKNGVCLKRHDRKQVSLCKKFLQGKCLADSCTLSHDVGPEKMPTCKYFLEGCCTRDACPYVHVKMSSNTLICIEFLQGYCVKGNKCERRHEYTCPEFDKSRKCSKGKYCPYPHKSQSHAIGHTDKHLQTEPKRSNCDPNPDVGVTNVNNIEDDVKCTKSTTDIACATNVASSNENRLRYYERRITVNDDIGERKKDIMKKINIMKSAEITRQTYSRHGGVIDTAICDTTKRSGLHELVENEYNQPAKTDCKPMKRRPIGSLPAYIPID